MQDIAGLRIVHEMGLAEQDRLVEEIRGLFASSRVDDRRARPSHGYRAVHVIAMIDERPVEIQVRTEIQDAWAQGMELLADELGRGIRYGEVSSPEGNKKLGVMEALSEVIAVLELYPPEERAQSPKGVAMLAQALARLRAILHSREKEGDAS